MFLVWVCFFFLPPPPLGWIFLMLWHGVGRVRYPVLTRSHPREYVMARLFVVLVLFIVINSAEAE